MARRSRWSRALGRAQLVLLGVLSACLGGDATSSRQGRAAALLGANLTVNALSTGLQVRLRAVAGETTLGERTVTLDSPGTDEVAFELDLSECLQGSGTGSCSFNLLVTLLTPDGTGTLDQAQVGPLTLAPGETKTVTAPVELHEIKRVDVTPNPLQLEVGQAVQLTATPRNALGQAVVRTGTTTWTSTNSQLAAVNTSGLVTGNARGGPVTITATINQQPPGSTVVNVITKPQIVLSPATVVRSANQGDVQPQQVPVQVTNAGDAILQGLTATPSGGCAWLSVALNQTTAPATATVTLNPTNLLAGGSPYTCVVTVASTTRTDVTPQQIAVTFNILQRPTINLAPSQLTFDAISGDVLPAAQNVAVTNSGSGTLNQLSIVSITDDNGTPLSWLSASLTAGPVAPTTVSVRPNTTQLESGTYSGRIEVRSTAQGITNSPQFITVTYDVANPDALLANPSDVTFRIGQGGPLPTAIPVAITTESGQVSSGLTVSINPTVSWLEATLSGATTPTQLFLQPIDSLLAPGTYTTQVSVASSTKQSTLPAIINVTFIVDPPGIVTSVNHVTFRAAPNSSLPGSLVVQVTSNGHPITGLSASSNVAWLNSPLNGTTTPTQLTLQPNTTGLGVGTYTAQVTVQSSQPGVQSAVIDVTYIIGVLPPGGDVVVINDINVFDDVAFQTPGNMTLVNNLLTYTAPGPRATQRDVWFDCGHGSIGGPSSPLGELCGSVWAEFHVQVSAIGYNAIDVFTAQGGLVNIPASVKVIILATPCESYTINEVNALRQFAAEGGRVLLVGEHSGIYQQCIPIENQLLSDLGALLTNFGNVLDCGVGFVIPPSSIRPHQITTGVTSLTVACASEIRLGPSDLPLFYDTSGSHLIGGVAAIDAGSITAHTRINGPSAATRRTKSRAPSKRSYTGQ